MTDSYSKFKYDVEFRKQVVEKVGLGFELPSANTGVGPNGPKLEGMRQSKPWPTMVNSESGG